MASRDLSRLKECSFATTTSPDGRFVAAHAIGADRFALYPVDGGEPHPIPGLAIGDMPLRFSTDGTALFVLEAPETHSETESRAPRPRDRQEKRLA